MSGKVLKVVSIVASFLIILGCISARVQALICKIPNQALEAKSENGRLQLYAPSCQRWLERGKVYLAFENDTGEFVSGPKVNVSGAVVETQEGKTYPADLVSADFLDS